MALTAEQIKTFNARIAQASESEAIRRAAKKASRVAGGSELLNPATLDQYLPEGADLLLEYRNWLFGWEMLRNSNPEDFPLEYQKLTPFEGDNHTSATARGSYYYVPAAGQRTLLFACNEQRIGVGGASSLFTSPQLPFGTNAAIIPFAVCPDADIETDEFAAMRQLRKSDLEQNTEEFKEQLQRQIDSLDRRIQGYEKTIEATNQLLATGQFPSTVVIDSYSYQLKTAEDARKFVQLHQEQKTGDQKARKELEGILQEFSTPE